jgi:hypothetical protein
MSSRSLDRRRDGLGQVGGERAGLPLSTNTGRVVETWQPQPVRARPQPNLSASSWVSRFLRPPRIFAVDQMES